MTKADVTKALSILKAVYPHSFKDLSKADGEALVALWARLFAADDSALVFAAIDALIASRTVGYSPTPGEVKEQMHRLNSVVGNDLDEQKAWAKVSKACANGLYGYREEFEALPEDIQRAIGEPEQLKAWAQMDADTVESVVASNFMRNYRALKQRGKELSMLPADVRQRLSDIADTMSIDSPPKPKQSALLPPKLEPMIRKALSPPAEAAVPKPATVYKPKSADDWETQRQKAIDRLKGA